MVIRYEGVCRKVPFKGGRVSDFDWEFGNLGSTRPSGQ